LSFLWTQTCAHGAFGTPDQATTTWTSSGGEVCVLAFNVESRGLVDRVEYRVTSLAAGSGVVQVDGVFVASPRISSASVGRCTILRAGADASCRGTYYPGQPVTVRVVHDGGEGATASLSDDCGGTVEGPTAAPTEAVYAWRAPAASALCRLRARIARDEMTDELAIALYVAACVDDTFEPNDRPEQAVPVSGTVAARLYANDDDWFSVSSATGVLRVIVQSRDAIATELYEGGAFVAGGVNGLRATVTPSNPYLLHLLPGTLAPSCASQYEMSVAACAPGPETVCENGADDDCDGLPDLFDPDCPGPVCWDGCPQGQICNEYGACVAHCADGYMSGDEGGVDCGGACPFKCPLGSHCWISPDCLPGLMCVGAVCSVP
jgi:hypothetical protein